MGDDKHSVDRWTLDQRNLFVSIWAGHGFRWVEDAMRPENKQGPTIGPDEKKRL